MYRAVVCQVTLLRLYAAVETNHLSPVMFLYTTYGPCSTKSPNMEVPPGPPCSQSSTGALSWPACQSERDTEMGKLSAPPSGHFRPLTTVKKSILYAGQSVLTLLKTGPIQFCQTAEVRQMVQCQTSVFYHENTNYIKYNRFLAKY